MLRLLFAASLPVLALGEFGAGSYTGVAPWAALVLVSNDTAAAQCSGTLVGARTIVTAGHCIEGFDNAVVYLSSNKVRERKDPAGYGSS